MSFGSITAFGADAAPDRNFERAARAEARRQGWPGYPESYDEAFVAGAIWARGQVKKYACEISETKNPVQPD